MAHAPLERQALGYDLVRKHCHGHTANPCLLLKLSHGRHSAILGLQHHFVANLVCISVARSFYNRPQDYGLGGAAALAVAPIL